LAEDIMFTASISDWTKFKWFIRMFWLVKCYFTCAIFIQHTYVFQWDIRFLLSLWFEELLEHFQDISKERRMSYWKKNCDYYSFDCADLLVYLLQIRRLCPDTHF